MFLWLGCEPSTNEHEYSNMLGTNSFIREKFVDGFDQLNPAGLGEKKQNHKIQ